MAEVSIKYKNVEIGSMNASGSKTCNTSGKYCEDDIVIEYTRPEVVLDGNATTEQVRSGATFYSNSTTKQTGTAQIRTMITGSYLPPSYIDATITPSTTIQYAYVQSGFVDKSATGVKVLGDANLVAENIRKGVSIFGVTGTYEGGGESATSETTDAQALAKKARVTINHTLSHTPVSVTSVSGTNASVTSWSVSGNVVTLTLYNTGTTAVLAYATITYTYYG